MGQCMTRKPADREVGLPKRRSVSSDNDGNKSSGLAKQSLRNSVPI